MSYESTVAAPCEIHTSHDPASLIQDKHHLIPHGWYPGRKVPPGIRLVIACPTGHRMIHYWIDHLLAGGSIPDHQSPEFQLAQEGIAEAKALGLVPRKTL